MTTWQPAPVLYPDVEMLLCDRTRELLTDQPDLQVGRKVPMSWNRAIMWNRNGGTQDPPFDTAAVMCRVFAPNDMDVTDLVALLLARLPSIIDGAPVLSMTVTGGPTDLGIEDSPMRQILFDMKVRGSNYET
ncbi:MAG: hypothetical protein LBN10_03400 [Propionibacteriaceae bacterium]|jgi:hypothetical protein|nr:hypothetical protein [Propionibacteriaceae bacterium]